MEPGVGKIKNKFREGDKSNKEKKSSGQINWYVPLQVFTQGMSIVLPSTELMKAFLRETALPAHYMCHPQKRGMKVVLSVPLLPLLSALGRKSSKVMAGTTLGAASLPFSGLVHEEQSGWGGFVLCGGTLKCIVEAVYETE